jgi:hypothetical protein
MLLFCIFLIFSWISLDKLLELAGDSWPGMSY